MTPNKRIALLSATGLAAISGSFIIKHITSLPDFAHGLLIGIGIGLLFTALIMQFKRRKA